jgi:purine-binding chemotaxis protein CheW
VPESEAPAPSAEEHVSEEEAEEAAEPVVQELETLAFRLGSEEYVVMVEQVKEVLKLRDLTPVPHAPAYVPGVISLRGAVLPVIDLAKRLSLAPGVRDEKSRIMVVSVEDEDAGLIVDRVLGVVRFLPDTIQPAPETGERGSEFLKGIVRKEGKLYILLDLEKAVGK